MVKEIIKRIAIIILIISARFEIIKQFGLLLLPDGADVFGFMKQMTDLTMIILIGYNLIMIAIEIFFRNDD